MSRPRPEPIQVVKQRRDAALSALVDSVPYIRFLNVTFDRRGDELTAQLNFDDKLIGNPMRRKSSAIRPCRPSTAALPRHFLRSPR